MSRFSALDFFLCLNPLPNASIQVRVNSSTRLGNGPSHGRPPRPPVPPPPLRPNALPAFCELILPPGRCGASPVGAGGRIPPS